MKTLLGVTGGLLLASSAVIAEPNEPKEEATVSDYRIVFHDQDGHTIAPDELKNFTGRVSYQIVSERVADPEAQDLHEQGRAAGERGDHDRAIALFEKAAELDPEWPYPFYDAAYTYLLKGDSEAAYDYYRRVDRLAPRGFFTTKVAVDSLRREREGTIKPGTYLAFVMLEWESDPQKKGDALQAILLASPEFPPGWHLMASMVRPEDRPQILEKGLDYSPDSKTRGDLLIQRALGLSQAGEVREAAELLGQVISDPESALDNEAIAKIVLAQISE